MHGPTNDLTLTFTDISGSETIVLSIICALIIVIGIYPQPVLHISDASVTHLFNVVYPKFPQLK